MMNASCTLETSLQVRCGKQCRCSWASRSCCSAVKPWKGFGPWYGLHHLVAVVLAKVRRRLAVTQTTRPNSGSTTTSTDCKRCGNTAAHVVVVQEALIVAELHGVLHEVGRGPETIQIHMTSASVDEWQRKPDPEVSTERTEVTVHTVHSFSAKFQPFLLHGATLGTPLICVPIGWSRRCYAWTLVGRPSERYCQDECLQRCSWWPCVINTMNLHICCA